MVGIVGWKGSLFQKKVQVSSNLPFYWIAQFIEEGSVRYNWTPVVSTSSVGVFDRDDYLRRL
jgi:hypothetical protein